jgi:hypothetical protein
MFTDLSPHVARAVSNKILMTNKGWYFQVKSLDGKTDLKRAKAKLEALIERINKDNGGLDALIDSWCHTAVTQGAIAGELALTDALDDVLDIYPVQPYTIYFERDANQDLVPFQQQGYVFGNGNSRPSFVPGFKRLNPVTFGYIPYQAPPDEAYGRSPIASVLQVIAFDLQMQKDIRQWAHTNAWGRLHVKVVEETLLKNAPPSLNNDPTGQKKRQWVADQIAAFASAYNKIKPDDAFFTSDAVEVDTLDATGKTFQVEQFLRAIDRRMFMALQELPVLMGSNEGTTETHGTVQLEVYASHIESFQKIISNLLEKLFSVTLQVWGIAGKVLWFFEPVRTTDRVKDAQADLMESKAEAFKRDQGWKTQDEVSIEITGHEAVADAPAQPVEAQAIDTLTTTTKVDETADSKKSDTSQDEPKADDMDENGQTEEDKAA